MNINLTLIGQSLTFLAFVFFCMKVVWPALLGVMQAREQRIAKGLEDAERADKDLALAKEQVGKQLREAKEQAAALVEQANKRASQIVDEAKAQAAIEAARIKTAAEADVARQVSQAREELRTKVAALAVAGAEKILAKQIDATAHNAMLNQLATEL